MHTQPAHTIKLMQDEIDRLRKMLTDHGIDPDAEYTSQTLGAEGMNREK